MIKLEFGSVDEMVGALTALGGLVAKGPVQMGCGPSFCDEPEPKADEPEAQLEPVASATVASEPKPTRKRGRPPRNKVEGGNTPIVSDDQLPAAPVEPVQGQSFLQAVGLSDEQRTELREHQDAMLNPKEPEPEAPVAPAPEAPSTAPSIDTTLDHTALRAKCIATKDALEAAGIETQDALDSVYGVLAKFGTTSAAEVPAEKIGECAALLDALVTEAKKADAN